MPQLVRMVIITGMSGAGKTLALQSLEDLGFFCVDNLPPALIAKFSELVRDSERAHQRVAIVCDLRGGEFFNALFDALNHLKDQDVEYQIVYLEADDDMLVRRYKASRRRHPLSSVHGRIVEGIARERELLTEVREQADFILNTSRMRPTELREVLTNRFKNAHEDQGMQVHVISFGFKYGIPIDADLVFDVRFLPNPYYVDALRSRSGQDPDVYEYVMQWPETRQFMLKLNEMIDFLIPQFEKEGKMQVVIGIGCTGGRHRSVAIAENLREYLQKMHAVNVSHRDVAKDGER